MKWFAAAGHINGGVSALVRAEAKDEQAAENLRDDGIALGALKVVEVGNAVPHVRFDAALQ